MENDVASDQQQFNPLHTNVKCRPQVQIIRKKMFLKCQQFLVILDSAWKISTNKPNIGLEVLG